MMNNWTDALKTDVNLLNGTQISIGKFHRENGTTFSGTVTGVGRPTRHFF